MRIKELLAASFFVCLPAYATTYYVDGNCPTAGKGSSKTCAGIPSSTTNNPKNNIDDGIALLTTAGDILNIRGAHPAHDAETTDFDGRYYGDWFRVLDKHGSSGSPLTIQPDGYTTPGTGEVVFIDGSKSPAGGWTQCSDCSTGTCAGVAGTCSQTWWASGESGQTVHAIQAQKSDGSVTFKVSGPGELSNAHSGYVSGRCSGETWHVCYASSD